MDKFLTNVEIKNFKSIKELKFDAKKVNVFIGKPNVGKSNILEALSLFCAPYETNTDRKFLSGFIRYNEVSNLFYDDEVNDEVIVQTNLGAACLRYHHNNIDKYDLILLPDGFPLEEFNKHNTRNADETIQKLILYAGKEPKSDNYYKVPPMYQRFDKNGWAGISNNPYCIIKKYYYQYLDKYDNKFPYFLYPPEGSNLFSTIHINKEIHKEIASLFQDNGLDFVMYLKEQKFGLQKKIDNLVYPYPYISIADTLKRYVFYLAAIHSNKDSVLLLEEPEVHSFPPYTKMLADKITKDETNQYFITTHSPYLLHTIIENTELKDLNIFITHYENYETKVRALGGEEIRQILDDSIDVFFNLDRFLEE